MLYRALLLALATAHAWNECAFPDVGYYAVDEGLGLSFAYGASAMNGKLYTGGYYKGHYAVVGVTDSGEVAPEPSATLWGDVTSDVQNLYVAETNAAGKMTKSWSMTGTGIQSGSPGHGAIVNRVQVDGVRAMLDRSHLAIKGDFSAQVTLPDGTLWSSGKHTDNSVRLNTKSNVQFVMKLDVSKTQGVGTGTTGWARVLDEDHLGVTIHPGGVDNAYVTDVHGDSSGNMILTYTGYSGYNASAPYYNSYGQEKCCGAMTGGVHYLVKLSAVDGSEVWKKVVPKALSMCTPTTDGSIFCAYTMSSRDGALDFGNGKTMPAVTSTKTGIVKFDILGVAQWAKATHDASFKHLAVTEDGTALVITGSTGTRGQNDLLSRIDTSAGNEGLVMWTDTGSGGGTHGFRGVQVSNDGTQVTTFGQITVGSPLTLTDSLASETTVTSRGSYTVWVAAYDATTGTGKWAMDGGSGGLDYFFAFGIDRDTNDIYVGGGVYSTPEAFVWGDVKRKNAMYQYKPSSDISGYVGTTKAFTAQIKSSSSPPSCLTNTCSIAVGPQASDVKPDMCYIDRHCYNKGDFSPYPGQHCMKCDPTTAAGRTAWSGPDTNSMCFIGGKCIAEGTHEKVPDGTTDRRGSPNMANDPCSKCIPSVSGTAYSPVAEKGCMLDMATFAAACYDDKGAVTMSETAKLQLMADKTSMTTTVATMTTTMATRDATISTLQVDKAALQADKTTMTTTVVARDATIVELRAAKEAAEQDGAAKAATIEAKDVLILDQEANLSEDKMPTWAIAIIVVIGAVLLLVIAILGVVVSREQQGKPIFVQKNSAATSGSSKI